VTSELELWSPAQLDTLRRTYLRGVPDAELALFAEVCGHLGLSPFRDEIAIVPRRVSGSTVWRHQVQVAGRRLLAVRTGELRGVKLEWCGPHAPEPDSPLVWLEAWLSEAPPHAARATVWREGWRPEGVSAVWPWRESLKFHAHNQQGTTVGPWADMPSHMLAKVAESKALRLAFPDVLTAEVAGEWDDTAVESYSSPSPSGDAPSAEVGTPSPRSTSPVSVAMMTLAQSTTLADYVEQLGLAGAELRSARMAYISEVLARDVTDTRSITYAEAELLLQAMRSAARALDVEPDLPADVEPEPEVEP
jgi:hypothetical protein